MKTQWHNNICFVHPIYRFLVFGHFWLRSYENTKILRNLCLNFAKQDGQDRKMERKSHNWSDQNSKNLKTKIWDERNNSFTKSKFIFPLQAMAPPDFGRSVNPISTRGRGEADYSHHIVTCLTRPHPDFQTFPRPCDWSIELKAS